MNKLIIDNNIDTNDIVIDTDTDMVVDLTDTEKDIDIHIVKGVNVKGFIKTNNTKNKISYHIDEDCNVILNKLSIDCSDVVDFDMNSVNSFLKYSSSLINYKDNKYSVSVKHKSKETESIITNHCINVDDNEFKCIVDGIIEKEAFKVRFKQDNKIINLKNGKSQVLPNLIVDNDDIEASHSVYIGTFDEDIKFYMMSRGLTEKECDDLLIRAFLLNNMDLTEKERDIYCSIIEKINK